jgi:hypothetical protein
MRSLIDQRLHRSQSGGGGGAKLAELLPQHCLLRHPTLGTTTARAIARMRSFLNTAVVLQVRLIPEWRMAGADFNPTGWKSDVGTPTGVTTATTFTSDTQR